MSVTQITDDNIIEGIDASKLTGSNLPAIDGSNLTGVSAGVWYSNNSADPTSDTNPEDGVGTIWINNVTGNMFSCTDATTDNNHWINIGSGVGDITYNPYVYQGTQYGYNAGGYTLNPTTRLNTIQRFSFITPSSHSSDIGDLTISFNSGSGHTSTTHGWTSAGWDGSDNVITIQKFLYASSTAGENHSELVFKITSPGGASSSTHGYVMGGYDNVVYQFNSHITMKFSFSSTVNASDIGNMAYAGGLYYQAAWSSVTHGYSACGYDYGGTGDLNVGNVEKYSFASDGGGISCNSLSSGRSYVSGSNSITHGYVHGGFEGVAWIIVATIDKYNFSSEAETSGIGNLTSGVRENSGQSSTTYGYSSGGREVSGTIQRYSFTSDESAVDTLANLVHTNSMAHTSGIQR